jgi:hypothetical protein
VAFLAPQAGQRERVTSLQRNLAMCLKKRPGDRKVAAPP